MPKGIEGGKAKKEEYKKGQKNESSTNIPRGSALVQIMKRRNFQ